MKPYYAARGASTIRFAYFVINFVSLLLDEFFKQMNGKPN